MHDVIRKLSSLLRNYKQSRIIKSISSPNGIVLEVGSGNQSVNCSNIMLDKYVCATSLHRSGTGVIRDFQGKPFVLGDGNQLPFKNRSISTVICRHVIEHVDNPVGFLHELQRVGITGYIEWPSIYCELIRGGFGVQERVREKFSSQVRIHLANLEHGQGSIGHQWFIVSIGQYLYFVAKSKELYPIYLMYGAYAKSQVRMLDHILREPISWCTWMSDNPLNAIVLSENVCNDSAKSLNEHYDINEQIEYLKSMNIQDGSSFFKSTNLQDLLCCPVCKKGDLHSQSRERLVCTICGRKYPVINEIPVLMEQAAY